MRRQLRPSKRFAILKRDGFRCKYCGASGDGVELHVDHVVPVSRGGTDHPANLVAACATCNMGKGDDVVEWFPCTPLIDINGDPENHAPELRAHRGDAYIESLSNVYAVRVGMAWHDSNRDAPEPTWRAMNRAINARADVLFGEDGVGIERCAPCQ